MNWYHKSQIKEHLIKLSKIKDSRSLKIASILGPNPITELDWKGQTDDRIELGNFQRYVCDSQTVKIFLTKTVKKIAALVAGTTMLGATIMGAMALDLSDYPAPFVSDGVFDGKIVVGANAATSDVVGAIDLAASLQAEATSTTEINIPGSAGTVSVSGDSIEFKTGSDIVRIGEAIGDVKETLTASDLEALKSGIFDTGESSTPVKQYL